MITYDFRTSQNMFDVDGVPVTDLLKLALRLAQAALQRPHLRHILEDTRRWGRVTGRCPRGSIS